MTLPDLTLQDMTAQLHDAQARIAELEAKLAAPADNKIPRIADNESLLNTLPGAVFQLSGDSARWAIDSISTGIRDIAGVAAADIVRSNDALFSQFLPADVQQFREAVSKAITTRSAWVCEGQLKLPGTGEMRWWQASARPASSDVDRIVFSGLLLDITAQKRQERFADHQRKELQDILDSLPTMIWFKDDKNTILRGNKAAALASGFTNTDDMVGARTEAVFPEQAEMYLQDDLEVIHSRQPKLGIVEQLAQSDGLHWVQSDKVPLYNPDGSIIGIVATVQDVTETRRAYMQTDTLYNVSQALTRVHNENELLQVAAETAMSHGCTSVILFFIDTDTKNQPEYMEIVAEWTPTGNNSGIGIRYKLRDFPYSKLWINDPYNSHLISDITTHPLADDQMRAVAKLVGFNAIVNIPFFHGGRWIGIMSFAWVGTRDYSEEEKAVYRALPALVAPVVDNMRLLKNLEGTIRELNQSLLFKDQFLATMSHELRTPMNAIMGYSSISLQREGIPDKVREMLVRIVVNSNRLLKLINDILDISRINAGRVEIVKDKFNLFSLANGWHQDFSKQTQDKGLDFIFEYDPTLPETTVGDSERIAQIAVNLLHNAIKFTDKGSVALRLTRHGDNLMIEVADTGIGIPDTYHHLIFEEFRQVDMGADRKYGGTGLGLSIVQKLCILMGSTVIVSSVLGQGSTFKVTLPLAVEAVQQNNAE